MRYLLVFLALTPIFRDVRAPFNDYPGPMYKEGWGEQMMTFTVHNLTEYFLKDAMYKLRLADHIRSFYKNTIGFELGMISASLMETFKHMLKVYRYYADEEKIGLYVQDQPGAKKARPENFMQAYSIIQSDFYEIRKARDLFHDVVAYFYEIEHRVDPKLEQYMDKYPGVDKKLLAQAIKTGMLSRRRARGNGPPPSIEVDLSPDTTDPELEDFLAKLSRMEPERRARNGTAGRWNKRTSNDTQVEAYKKLLRYKSWVEKWKGFNPQIEGVDIQEQVADIGLHNASNFLAKELKGIV